MKKYISGLLLLVSASITYAQKVTIGGIIKSKSDGETVIGATVKADSTAGTVSNEYGFYSLNVPSGTYVLEISSVGMETIKMPLTITKDTTINIKMEDGSSSLQEVVITESTGGRSLKSAQTSVEKLSMKEIEHIPVLFGEKDVMKAIQLLPGIKSAGDGNAGMFVRGGAADQNLILLDEAPVYNASHLLGFFSTFNSDALKDITVYKGGMPARYGGRLSSVLDIKMNDGNNQDFDVSGGVGLISAKLNVEGPIQKDKSSFLITGRRTYADMFLKLSNEYKDNSLYFYDLNAKVNYILGDKDRLYLSGYFGKDKLGASFGDGEGFGLDWGNATGTLRWNHIFNNNLFSNTSLIFSNYNYNISIKSGAYDFDIKSRIQDLNFKEEIQWYLNNNNTIKFGYNLIHHDIKPGEVKSNDLTSLNSTALESRYALENVIYASNAWKVSNKLNVEYGARLGTFTILGPGDYYGLDANGNVNDTMHYNSGQAIKTYLNLEPRLSASYMLNTVSSLKASYARNTQNLHLISNSTSSSPTDKWLASTNLIKPEISDQVSLGYYRDFANDKYELTVETYYKTMQNQIDYRDGANVYLNSNAIESQLLFGKGRAYGLEFLLKKKVGRLSGWISYTLSKTERQIDGINNNQWYNARQDRTHDFAIVASYELSRKWTLSANWVYYTGDAITFPAGKYQVDGQTVYYYTNRNAYRMPAYHRLDLGATCKLAQRKKWSSELAFSLYNAYGRENAYTIVFRDNKDDPNKTEAVKIALFKFIPSISYNFKF
ncbi:TonB-dependent receptor [Taibaiella lutea]|uniref:TonB-dependent receptor n=1 Tax=Taibaiella lutea TaxID=2608001 RepID=A0A5M6CQ52_9BACT|nr:TonB-dependent receptor [Taibaiella lutea]KAA5537401.1 TonB-dependent receptor [Taibaiella lutea]